MLRSLLVLALSAFAVAFGRTHNVNGISYIFLPPNQKAGIGRISASTQCPDEGTPEGPLGMRVMKKDGLGLRVMLEEDEVVKAKEAINADNKLGSRLMKKDTGYRIMKKADSNLGMRVMKKDNLGMRVMKKDDGNLGLRLMKKEDPNFGIRVMKKGDPDQAADEEEDGEMVPELPVYDWIMRTMSLRSDPDDTLKSINNYQPRGMRIMKRSPRPVTRTRMYQN